MPLSQKAQYGVRAVFELARRWNDGPVKVGELAKAQAVPPRFLEVILNQLKQSGIVDSRRGSTGGYFLAKPPASITVGEVIRFLDGPLSPVDCEAGKPGGEECTLSGECVFISLWKEAEDALKKVYDGTSFLDLVERDRQMQGEDALIYNI